MLFRSSLFMPEIVGAGVALLDYDQDADLDVYLVNGGHYGRPDPPPVRNRLFRREPDGSYVDVTAPTGLAAAGYGMGVAVGDDDNDGATTVMRARARRWAGTAQSVNQCYCTRAQARECENRMQSIRS